MSVSYNLRITIGGVVALQRHVATAKTLISDFGPLWSKVLAWFLKMEMEQFAAEGYGRWPQLAPSTVKKRGSAHPILMVTGALFRSLTDSGPGWYQERTPTSIELGTTLTVKGNWNLGLLHQTGTHRSVSNVGKSGKTLKHPVVSFGMPPRPPIDPLWKERADLRALYATYLHAAITGGAFGAGTESA